MSHKKVLLSILTSIIVSQTVAPSNSHNLRESIKGASTRAFWGWVKARGIPLVAGGAMVIIPPLTGILGVAGAASHCTKDQMNVFIGMMIGGFLLSKVSVPIGSLLVARQSWLIKRDLGLYHKFTSSTAHLNQQSLPSVSQVNSINTHNQLLSAAQQYFETEGNAVEKKILTIPGLRGFKKT